MVKEPTKWNKRTNEAAERISAWTRGVLADLRRAVMLYVYVFRGRGLGSVGTLVGGLLGAYIVTGAVVAS